MKSFMKKLTLLFSVVAIVGFVNPFSARADIVTFSFIVDLALQSSGAPVNFFGLDVGDLITGEVNFDPAAAQGLTVLFSDPNNTDTLTMDFNGTILTDQDDDSNAASVTFTDNTFSVIDGIGFESGGPFGPTQPWGELAILGFLSNPGSQSRVENRNAGGTLVMRAGNLQTPAVPIPSAVWLLGSGLLGMIGIRRKFTK